MGSIKNLIFDLGNVLINIDTGRFKLQAKKLNPMLKNSEIEEFLSSTKINNFEKGIISEDEFASKLRIFLNKPDFTLEELKAVHNTVCICPTSTLKLLPSLAQKGYQIYVLSNTDPWHIEYCQKYWNDIKNCFVKFYFSYNLGALKNEGMPFQVLINENIKPEESVFIDDLEENILASEKFNFHTFHAQFSDILNIWLIETFKKSLAN